ncbi:hypothetical protein ACWDSL_50850 [Streptomyces sp. NPDC000941]
MGKAFVAKLAKEGARDPEALAAWIGRKKHGPAVFKKLAAAGQRKQSSQDSKPSGGATRKKAASAPQRPAARDLKRGFHPSNGRFAVSDSELEVLRERAAFNRQQMAMLDAAGVTGTAERRRTLAEQERQIADAEYARETAVGQRAYEAATQAERAAVLDAVKKARLSKDLKDLAAAADSAEAFSQKTRKSPYGTEDASYFAVEAKSARASLAEEQRAQERRAVQMAQQTLPPPNPGETPVAHAAHLGSAGRSQSFGDPTLGRKVISSSPGVTAMPDTGAEGHDSALANVSPAFRKKVMAARASGRPWLHNIGHDSGGAEIHTLQYEDANGKPQRATYLERNGAAYKRLSPEQQMARYNALSASG